MSIIRFNTDEVFTTDSSEYEILYEAAKKIKGTSGAVVEIGTRRGGSAKIIIDALVENQDTDRSMFCIDPYGNIDYPLTNKSASAHMPNLKIEGDPLSTEINNYVKLDYDNTMRNRIIPSLYYYAYNAGLNFTFFCLEDSEFFKRYSHGVPVYNNEKTIENKYSFVFFDGPHDNRTVDMETYFFNTKIRTTKGSVFVYDDVWMYDHDKIEKELFDTGWQLITRGAIKASYIKT